MDNRFIGGHNSAGLCQRALETPNIVVDLKCWIGKVRDGPDA